MLAGVLALTAAKTLTDRGRRCPARSCPGPCRSPGARVPGAHSRATRSTARATWREAAPRCAIVIGSVMDGRDVAQFGSALDWGSRGRRFKSCRPDGEIGRCLFRRCRPICLLTCAKGCYSRSLVDLQLILLDGRFPLVHAYLEQIWSTASKPGEIGSTFAPDF